MIEGNTPPDAKILGLISVANAYLARDARVTWQSAETDRLLYALRRALQFAEPFEEWRVAWPPESLQALRFRLPAGSQSEWEIDEARIYSGGIWCIPARTGSYAPGRTDGNRLWRSMRI